MEKNLMNSNFPDHTFFVLAIGRIGVKFHQPETQRHHVAFKSYDLVLLMSVGVMETSPIRKRVAIELKS
ncbi:hypothetical protein PVK06_037341 [Gossypium arboreum]|uniref:Uncharacterized protein n=1 Tax=Gossypium arboreum TaxID=29729 RepID=A0ABR0MX14_GOSAR|nr:hypothetical protein PVK06_037341 [Gossypium arboreum]